MNKEQLPLFSKRATLKDKSLLLGTDTFFKRNGYTPGRQFCPDDYVCRLKRGLL